MEWNGLWGLVYGLLGGLFEFLPVSPQVHQRLLLKMTGLEAPGYGLSFAVHLGALAAVIVACYPNISKLARERSIARTPKRSRKRYPDAVSLMELRLLRVASVPMVLSCVLTPWLSQFIDTLWVMALLTVLSSIVVLLPNYMTRANKDARSLSPLDAVLVGAGGMLGMLPGFSRIGMLTAVGSMRGMERQYGLNFAYLLMIPALVILSVGDLGMILFDQGAFADVSILAGMLACVGSFAAAMAGIGLMRFLAVRAGFESLAYYGWGLAMFTLIFNLIG